MYLLNDIKINSYLMQFSRATLVIHFLSQSHVGALFGQQSMYTDSLSDPLFPPCPQHYDVTNEIFTCTGHSLIDDMEHYSCESLMQIFWIPNNKIATINDIVVDNDTN